MTKFSDYLSEYRIDSSGFNLQALYDELNHKIWDGHLPKVPLMFRKTPKHTTAFCQYKHRNGIMIPDSAFIQVDPRKYEYDKLKALMAHEMIHLELAIAGDFKTGHGLPFDVRRLRYSKTLGLEIPMSDNIFDEEEYGEISKEIGYVIMYYEGRVPSVSFMTSKIAETQAPTMRVVAEHLIEKDRLGLGYKLVHSRMVIGSSPLMNKYPVSRKFEPLQVYKAKFYPIEEKLINGIKVSKTLYSV